MWGHLACQVNSFFILYTVQYIYPLFLFPFLFENKILCLVWWCYPSCNYVCFISFYFVLLFFLLAQVSGSKLWQTERSCMCCQESGEREATVSLLCPKAAPGEPKLRRVKITLTKRDDESNWKLSFFDAPVSIPRKKKTNKQTKNNNFLQLSLSTIKITI